MVVPLRVSPEYHRRLARRGNLRKLRRLLKAVPIYRKLLDQYPGVTIKVRETVGGVAADSREI